jgi:two-component system cell cycle sensor histidine kinase/response regulator CckA
MSAIRKESQPDPRARRTILLVEDDAQLRKLARLLLEREGYDVLVASGAGEALAFAREATCRIDLVLTDVVLPHMNGRDLVDCVRLARPDLKVIFMSGFGKDVIARHGVFDPSVEFLQKPMTPEVLVQKIRAVLGA